MNGRFVAGLFAGTCISLTSFSLGAYATYKFQQQLSNNNNNLSLTTTPSPSSPTSLPSPQETSTSSSLTTTKEEKITACFSKEQIESIIASDSFQKALFNYQAMKKPKRIILIRHGESEGNINPCIYATKPDNQIELTEEGKKQALHAGAKLKQIIEESSKKSGKPESIQFIIR